MDKEFETGSGGGSSNDIKMNDLNNSRDLKREFTVDLVKGSEYVHDNPRYVKEEGRRNVGKLIWPLVLILPTGSLILIFGVIPLFVPTKAISSFYTFTFFVCPISCAIISYFNGVSFLYCMSVSKPFKFPLFIPLIVAAVTMGTGNLIFPLRGTIYFYFAIVYAETILISFIAIYIYEIKRIEDPEKRKPFQKSYKNFIDIQITINVFLFVLILYIFAWRYASETLQRFLSPIMAIIIFIFRKVLLSLTDCFAIEVAMLISAYWVENMHDYVRFVSYPQTRDPTTYAIISTTNTLTNLANLLFLTDNWFRFRVWVKPFLKGIFCCKPECCPNSEIDLSDQPDDRGHSNNRPGYRRRQVRFFFWKLISETICTIFYITCSPVLRYGYNNRFFPFNSTVIEEKDYIVSIYYSIAHFGLVFITGLVGVNYIKKCHKDVWKHLIYVYVEKLIRNPHYIAFVTSISIVNGILSLSVLTFHNQVWYTFKNGSGYY